jgi:trimeric autotransporter adhesin
VGSYNTYVKASNSDTDDSFGTGVALSADAGTLAVSALGESSAATGVDGDQTNNTAKASGAVYVFR